MPWSKTNVPPEASKLKGHELDIFIAAANAALKEYKDDVRAIRTGLAAVGKYRESKKTMKSTEQEVEKSKGAELTIEVNDDSVKSGLFDSVMLALREFFLSEEIKDAEEDKMEAEDMMSFTQKSLNEELMQATFIVLEPETPDAHGDVYSADEIRKACHNFNMFCRKAYLNHSVETDKISFVESYTAPDDMLINDFMVKKGTWLAVTQFNDVELWKQAKEDGMIGLSIGAVCKVHDV